MQKVIKLHNKFMISIKVNLYLTFEYNNDILKITVQKKANKLELIMINILFKFIFIFVFH